MSVAVQTISHIPAFSSDLFSLTTLHREDKTVIHMQFFTEILYTSQTPHAFKILKKYLPSIFRCQCFNTRNVPFRLEIKDTEIGHLFEHILLEYLCLVKLSKGHKKAEFCGFTSWNWNKDMPGTFYITIDLKSQDSLLFAEALEKSLRLLRLILELKLAAS